jgi:hypothetical protein
MNKMNKKIGMALSLAIITATFFFASCKKDEGKLPDISFKTGAQYTAKNDTMQVGDTILVGINAAKTEKNDVLISFDGSVSVNNGPVASFVSEQLSGSNGDNYTKDMTIVTGKTAGTEKYIFTIVNKDGLRNQVSFTLTLLP